MVPKSNNKSIPNKCFRSSEQIIKINAFYNPRFDV